MATKAKAKTAEQVSYQVHFTHAEDGRERAFVAADLDDAQKRANAEVNAGHDNVNIQKITYTTEDVPVARDKD